jgi:predicted RNase H-like HicB family nuclease
MAMWTCWSGCDSGVAAGGRMKRDLHYYDGLPWRVVIEPEQQDDGRIIYVASHPEFDGVLGAGDTPEAALLDLHAARRSMIEALLAEGYPIPEPAVATAAAS